MSSSGGGKFGSGRYFRGQKYRKLKKECVKRGHLFVDTLFPPTNYSLFLDEGRHTDIEWKRPSEIAADPHLFVEGASSNDVTQGILGNCWFVSACSALTHNQTLLAKVIPDADQQEWSPKRTYCGIFRFCFWRFGEWMEVVIDDLLPTRDGKLLFARSKTSNEFWSALLEKAFAKLYGCYENLVGGRLSDALQDVSGGVAETINVVKYLSVDGLESSNRLFDHVRTSFDNGALIVAAIAAKTKEEIEMSLDCGLVKGHAYAVTGIRNLELQRQKASLGTKLGMPWKSFVEYFTDISLCQLFNTSHFTLSKRYHEDIHFGEWTTNGSKSGSPKDLAGGCLNFTATCCSNPQFLLDVTTGKNEMYFSLTQREINEGLKRREPHISIGMHLMRVERNRKYRVHQPMEGVATSDYSNSRSVCLTVRNVPPGRYILMPTTFAPREQTTFLLRAYGDFHFKLRPLTKHAPRVSMFPCGPIAPSVTRLHITHAEIADGKERNLYCVMVSERERCVTRISEASTKPEWNDSFLFHSGQHAVLRKEKRQKYRVELWESRMGPDRLVATADLVALMDNDSREVELSLLPPKTKNANEALGKISVQICAYDDPLYV